MKALPILNAVGCLFLVGFIVVQWNDGQKLQKKLNTALINERNTQNEKIEVEKRVFQLQSDVDNLKSSVDLMKAEAEEAKKKIADGELLAHQLHTGLTFNFAHFEALNTAIEQRNGQIESLNSSLVATRRRLDEAIEKLKQAGAR